MKKLVMVVLLSVAGLAYAAPEAARHQFTSAVVDREPTDQLADALNISPIFYFTELIDLQDTTVTHRWLFNGNVMAEVSFNVGGPRWRVYSSKQIQPHWDGQWRVEVVDESGVVIAADDINILMD